MTTLPLPATPTPLRRGGVLYHLGLLTRLRARAFGRQLTAGAGPWGLLWPVVGAGLLVALGAALAPALSAVPGGKGQNAPALELNFWVGLVALSALNFRAMEHFFRDRHARALALLPVAPGAFFAERLFTVAAEALSVGIALSVVWLAMWWQGAGWIAPALTAMSLLGLPLAALGGTSAMLAAAVVLETGPPTHPEAARQRPGWHPYGRHGEVFLMAPAVGLGTAAALYMLAKLAAGELVAREALARSAQVGFGLLLLVSAGLVWAGFRQMSRSYLTTLALFQEVDQADFAPVMDYQKSAIAGAVQGEGLLPDGPLRALYRAQHLELGRRQMLGRLARRAAILALAIFAWRTSPTPLASVALAVWPLWMLAAFARPWQGVWGFLGGRLGGMGLGISSEDVAQVAWVAGLREALWQGVPVAVVALGLWVGVHEAVAEGLWVAAAAVAGPLALHACATVAVRLAGWRRGPSNLAVLALAALWTAGLALDLRVGTGVAASFAAVGLLVGWKHVK